MKKRPEPFLWKKQPDGSLIYRCTMCHEWKPESGFYKPRDPERSNTGLHGLRTKCRDCESAYAKREYQNNPIKRKKNMAAVQRYHLRLTQQAQNADKEMKKWMEGRARKFIALDDDVYPIVLEWTERAIAMADGNRQIAADGIGVDAGMLYNVLKRNRESMEVEILERIAIYVNRIDELDRILPVPGVDGWNKLGDRHCQDCGSWFHPHYAKGMCERCYVYQMKYPGRTRLDNYINMWNPKHQLRGCIGCGTKQKKHVGKGYCTTCYFREFSASRKRKRAEAATQT